MRRLSLAWLVAAAAGCFFACTGDDPSDFVSGPDASTQTGNDAGGASSSSGSADASDTDSGPGPVVDAGPCDLAADFGAPRKIIAASSLGLDLEPTLTENELTLYFARDGNVYSLSRLSRDADFEGPPKEVAEVDTDGTLYWQSAAITRDGQTLLLGTKQLYLSTMSGGKFGTPVKVNANGSDVSGEHPYVTFDQGAAYFNSAPGAPQTIKRATIITGTAWSNVTTFTELGTYNRFPVVSADELTIYFASTAAGGLGGDDIWVAKRAGNEDDWGAPMPLPGPINRDGNEAPSWLSSDGCRLYLMMSGKESINYDIYVATKPR
jgi:hypothetical protein